MQVLRDASNGTAAAAAAGCAREILDGVPPVMWFIRRRMRAATKGLSVPQYRTMCVIDRLPSQSLSAVAEYLGTSLPTTSRTVAGLVARGLLARVDRAEDRRRIALTLTPRGRAVLANARSTTERLIAAEVKGFSPQKKSEIVAAMRLLKETFEPLIGGDSEEDGDDDAVAKRQAAVAPRGERGLPLRDRA